MYIDDSDDSADLDAEIDLESDSRQNSKHLSMCDQWFTLYISDQPWRTSVSISQTWRADQDLEGGSGLNIFLINSHEAVFQLLDFLPGLSNN